MWYNVIMENDFPRAVKACLWSYDLEKIDLANADHRTRLIENVLNHGTSPAIDWLFKHFDRKEITEVIARSSTSSWNRKSLALWSLVFGTSPQRDARYS